MIDLELLQQAHRACLLPGVKPEDYFFIGEKYPLMIAKIIRDEYFHLLKMKQMQSRLGLLGKFYRKFILEQKEIRSSSFQK